MAPLTTYLLPAMVAVTAVRAVDLPSLVPKCAPPCLYEAVDENSTCEKDEDACICRDIYSIKRHSESCLEDKCSDIEYGAAMLGFDNFCKAVEDGGPTSATATGDEPTTAPATTTEESAPTSEGPWPTSEAPEPTSGPSEPSDTTSEEDGTMSIPEPSSMRPTITKPDLSTPAPTATMPLPTNPGSSSGDSTLSTSPVASTTSDGGEETPTAQPPGDAGARFDVSFGLMAAAFLAAAIGM